VFFKQSVTSQVIYSDQNWTICVWKCGKRCVCCFSWRPPAAQDPCPPTRWVLESTGRISMPQTAWPPKTTSVRLNGNGKLLVDGLPTRQAIRWNLNGTWPGLTRICIPEWRRMPLLLLWPGLFGMPSV